jgi:hypothetical protein
MTCASPPKPSRAERRCQSRFPSGDGAGAALSDRRLSASEALWRLGVCSTHVSLYLSAVPHATEAARPCSAAQAARAASAPFLFCHLAGTRLAGRVKSGPSIEAQGHAGTYRFAHPPSDRTVGLSTGSAWPPPRSPNRRPRAGPRSRSGASLRRSTTFLFVTQTEPLPTSSSSSRKSTSARGSPRVLQPAEEARRPDRRCAPAQQTGRLCIRVSDRTAGPILQLRRSGLIVIVS